MHEPSAGFLAVCAQVIGLASEAVLIANGEAHINAQAAEMADGGLRIVLRNKSLAYAQPVIDVGCPIEVVQINTPFPTAHIQPDGSRFRVKVPGRGATIVTMRGLCGK